MLIPWALLNFKDPSHRIVIENFHQTGAFGGIQIDDISVQAVLVRNGEGIAWTNPGEYSWEIWEEAVFRERLKQSYYKMKEVFAAEIVR